MNGPMVLRLVWKEYRVHRGFWLSIACIAVLGQLYVWSLSAQTQHDTQLSWLFGLALACPAFYALGWGATTFAGEREEGTVELLRNLAVPAGRVFLSKLGFGLVSSLALLGVLYGLALVLALGQAPPLATHQGLIQLWRVWAPAALEFLAWGLFYSLLTKRPLHAACLAALTAVAVPLAISNTLRIFWQFFSHGQVRVEFNWTAADPPWRTVLAACVLIMDGWIARRWLLERRWRRPPSWPVLTIERTTVPVFRWSLGRLLWQEYRQAWRTISVLGGLAFLALLVLPIFLSGRLHDRTTLGMAVMLVMAGLTTLMGSCVFLAEQEARRFRFLAERGLTPGLVWLGKQTIWLPVTILGAMVLQWILFSVEADWKVESEVWAALMLVPWVGYAAGQLASILISRGLIAGMSGLILAAVLFLWQILMTSLCVPWWWSVLPIPLVLFLASYVSARDWLLERGGWRRWLRLLAVIVPVAVVLPPGVAAYRLYEIPAVGPGFSPDEFLRPVTEEERQTADMYRHAVAVLKRWKPGESTTGRDEPSTFPPESWDKATAAERAWLDENQEALGITLRATRRETCVFRDLKTIRIDDPMTDEQATRELSWLLALDARRLESAGNLDEALGRYQASLRLSQHVAARGNVLQWSIGLAIEAMVCERMPLWAAHSSQTPERIRRAMRLLDDSIRSAPPAVDAFKADYLMCARLLDAPSSEVYSMIQPLPREQAPLTAVGRLAIAPWERQRAHRMLDLAVAAALTSLGSTERDLASGRGVDIRSHRLDSLGPESGAEWAKWTRNTPLATIFAPFHYWVSVPVYRETRFRALRLILAIKGWQLEHGRLPPTLWGLVPEYFERLPLDPYTGEPFGYRPEGFPTAVTFGMPSRFDARPGQPLLWSAGPELAELVETGVTEQGVPTYRLRGHHDPTPGNRHPAGWAFPIP